METLKKTSKFLIIATVTALLAACGGGKGGGNGTAVNPLDCQNCAGITSPTLLATAAGTSIYSKWPAEIADLRIFGDANQLVNTVSANYNVYNGVITAQGVLRIRAAVGDANWAAGGSGCSVAAGDYALTTYRAGSINMGTNMEIPEMVAGPMRVRITQAMLYKEGSSVRLYGQVHILSVNGQTCSSFFTTMN